MSRCHTPEKVRYPSKKAARRAMVGDHWHVGHIELRQKLRKRR